RLHRDDGGGEGEPASQRAVDRAGGRRRAVSRDGAGDGELESALVPGWEVPVLHIPAPGRRRVDVGAQDGPARGRGDAGGGVSDGLEAARRPVRGLGGAGGG